MAGSFVISLDFELWWGIHDAIPLSKYRENLLGERIAVEALLALFSKRHIRVTWATVGALFCSSRRELLDVMPRQPRYADARLSPYSSVDTFGDDESHDPIRFAPSLVRKIASTPGQELATHTFSHLYCLEPGQTAADFDADLSVVQRLAEPYGGVKSLVFPRNQYNAGYRDVMLRHGIRTYRSNGAHWPYTAGAAQDPPVRRAVRLLDTYLPLAGSRTHVVRPARDGLTDVPASSFLRPFSPTTRLADPMRLRRLTRAMTLAAARDECFHLWWHPHNFGTHLRDNLRFLENVLDHYSALNRKFRFESMSMGDLAIA